MKNVTKTLFSAAAAALVIGMSSCAGPEGEHAKTGDAQNPATVEAAAVTYNIDAATSTVKWEGAKVTGKHSGTFGVKGGSLNVKNNELVGGTLELDMTKIVVTDLAPGKGKEKLEGHLSAADFFDVAKYPTSKFEITGAKKVEGGAANEFEVSGNLTLREATKNVTFKATIDVTDAEVKATAAQFVINRQDWGIAYPGMKDDLIKNEVGIAFELVARK
jgi:polyisoprenoid-binding protein YceI